MELAQMETQYTHDKIILYETLEKLIPPPVILQAPVGDHTQEDSFFKLEKIKAPKFNGNISKWNNFKGIYGKLVHDNANLASIQKFFVLHACLEGEAFELIENIDVTSENYASAWKLLNDRYDDESRLIWTHLKDLFSIRKMKNETSDEARFMTRPFVLARYSLT
ncbi:uncharacterized protein LOC107044954 [Diachasma alloeum]|uniref:uncharacterized protein LOC107044954 n=1 Tax=Diachasma alloeum TaxID=454923 RepID=UPI00073831F6|nr:uncharacterized protein LOC107044954 [Diachasma alloeum]